MTEEKKYYTEEYWFDNPINDEWHQGGEKYYVNNFYEQIVFKLDIPKTGKIVLLGTHNCVSFDKLCKHFGYDRVVGYDLYNPKKHPNVIIKDCLDLNDEDNYPIAFIHNDLGSFSTTPKLKMHGQKWAIKNIVKGGYILGNNNYNRAKVKIEELMTNFKNTTLKDLNKDFFDLSGLPSNRLDGYMISKRLY